MSTPARHSERKVRTLSPSLRRRGEFASRTNSISVTLGAQSPPSQPHEPASVAGATLSCGTSSAHPAKLPPEAPTPKRPGAAGPHPNASFGRRPSIPRLCQASCQLCEGEDAGGPRRVGRTAASPQRESESPAGAAGSSGSGRVALVAQTQRNPARSAPGGPRPRTNSTGPRGAGNVTFL